MDAITETAVRALAAGAVLTLVSLIACCRRRRSGLRLLPPPVDPHRRCDALGWDDLVREFHPARGGAAGR